MAAKDHEQHPRRPWRDNIEAITMAIIMAVMLKYFVIEAYKIPTGSMQPTLMGNDETGIHDRILVDKLSFHFRDPERFEVVVFKYPLDRSKNFIKRIWGMPSEDMEIKHGDVWVKPSGSEADFAIPRRSRSVQRAMLKRLVPDNAKDTPWKPVSGASKWTLGVRDVEARGDGTLRYPKSGAVMDVYTDGYPGEMGRHLRRGRGSSGRNPVGDVRIDGDVRALAGCKAAIFELQEGVRRYRVRVPGPADDASAQPTITISGLDGEVVFEQEVPPATDQRAAILLAVEGEGADFSDLMIYRDIYYTEDAKMSEWEIPDDHYVMLGDNTQDSSDSREWTFRVIELAEEELARIYGDGTPIRSLRGNLLAPNKNPITVPGGPHGPPLTWLRDEWGELHAFPPSAREGQDQAPAPFVPRHLITGRALLVFWPFRPSLDVYRVKWIR